MSEGAAELSSFFGAPELDTETFDKYADLAYASARTCERFADLVGRHAEQAQAGGDAALKAAAGYLILGRYQQAWEWFAKAGTDKYRHYYAARAAVGLGRHEVSGQNLLEHRGHGR